MTITIIVPTIRANPTLLDECVLAVGYTAPNAELIIADGFTKSYGENCNEGAGRASGDLFIFLNDDTIPAPLWLEPLIDAFDDPTVGIAGSCLRYPDTLALQHAGIYFDTPNGVLTAHNVTDEDQNLTRDVDAVTGACLAIRSHLFYGAQGFDTAFVNGYEDVDLCLRVRAGGWRVRYCAESVVLHHESASGQARWTHVASNVARLQALWNVRTEEITLGD